MKAYIYILKDTEGRYYVGSTNNLPERIRHHKGGFTPTTHRMKNPKLVLAQSYPSLEMARKIERKIKLLKRKDYIEKMVDDGYIKVSP